MSRSVPDLESVGVPAGLWPLVRSILAQALVDLGIAADFVAVSLSVDDMPGCAQAWVHVVPELDGQRLVLTCHSDVFCHYQPFSEGTMGPVPVWTSPERPEGARLLAEADFSAKRAAMFLYHQLLTVADIRQGSVCGEQIPAGSAEGFGIAWAVTVDGRLQRRSLPGFPLGEVRRGFAGVFAAAGVLMPRHWQIFESLWLGDLAGQDVVLQAVDQLPQLSKRS